MRTTVRATWTEGSWWDRDRPGGPAGRAGWEWGQQTWKALPVTPVREQPGDALVSLCSNPSDLESLRAGPAGPYDAPQGGQDPSSDSSMALGERVSISAIYMYVFIYS